MTEPTRSEQLARREPKNVNEALSMLSTVVAPFFPDEHVRRAFVRAVWRCVKETRDLGRCTALSFLAAASDAAELGLMPATHSQAMAYLIPRRNKGVWEANLQLGYRGLLKMAADKDWSVAAAAVHENDLFSIERGTVPVIRHSEKRSARGALTHTYAVISKDGRAFDFEVLDLEEIERRRHRGQAPDAAFWTNDYERMAVKSAVRALLARQPLAPNGEQLRVRFREVEEEPAQLPALAEPEPESKPEPEPAEADPTRPSDRELSPNA